ncbi:MAG: sodium:solute symporter family protein [Burkholderiaceae bacterium]
MTAPARSEPKAFKAQLDRVYFAYTCGFLVFTLLLFLLEQIGVARNWIGGLFLLSTVALYAGIGVLCRTTDVDQYYVAGRQVPAVYNGMATGADWMSAASFIGMAGTVYLSGFGGLAFVLGWTGGYCLVALLLAPYLRRFGQYTIPDFLGARYESNVPRAVGAASAILCSFVYIVAQIYGVGLITARLTGFAFEMGVFIGLGGILVCSFLGGMRAVTWTQVAQYVILIVAYIAPVVWLSVKQTGNPVPQAVYGYQMAKITELERRLIDDPKEKEVVEILRSRVVEYDWKLRNPAAALATERENAERRLAELRAAKAGVRELQAAARELAALPKSTDEAIKLWSAARASAAARAAPLAGMPPQAQAFAGDPDGDAEARRTFELSRRNFLALVFCLMVGTAALPHILTRCYTTPSVREARVSVTWSLFFIALLYVTAPALAVLVKFEVFSHLVGISFDQLPAWTAAWSKVDPSLLAISDLNKDGIVQLGEIRIGADIIVLAMPEIAQLPYVISGLVAAGGLAAALSTADGLLLTIANALSHDTYFRMINPQARPSRRVAMSKVILLVTAIVAAYVAAQKPAEILFMVSAAFSLAAAAFFPALVLGVFWKRANRWGATAGMLAGLGTTLYYLVSTEPWMRGVFGITRPIELWWGIQPISAGVFGVPVGFAVIVIVSLLTPRPGPAMSDWIDRLRVPVERPRETAP